MIIINKLAILKNAASKDLKRLFIVFSSLPLAFILFVNISSIYEGDVLHYLCFSISSCIMLWLGLTFKLGYGAAALSIFLWLGLWFKLSINLLLHRPFTEATGGFDYWPFQYDELLSISTVVCIGVIFAWVITKKLRSNKNHILSTAIEYSYKYKYSRLLVWLFLIAFILFVNIFNVFFGIMQSGLVARTIFVWPLNALICWLLYSGLALLVAGMLNMDYLTNKSLSIGIFVLILEAAVSSITSISRGLYIWHVLPIFLVLWKNIDQVNGLLTRKKLINFSFLAILIFVVVGISVNLLRGVLYDEKNIKSSASNYPKLTSEMVLSNGGKMVALITDRWVGAEGVMVAVGYPDKGISTFKELLIERPAIGYITKYQAIAQSHYVDIDANKYQFATLPGLGGFLYLSGSKLVVLVGAFLLSMFIASSEWLLDRIFRNQFLCAMSGLTLANMVAQIGVTPMQLLPQITMNFVVIGIISFFQLIIIRQRGICI